MPIKFKDKDLADPHGDLCYHDGSGYYDIVFHINGTWTVYTPLPFPGAMVSETHRFYLAGFTSRTEAIEFLNKHFP